MPVSIVTRTTRFDIQKITLYSAHRTFIRSVRPHNEQRGRFECTVVPSGLPLGHFAVSNSLHAHNSTHFIYVRFNAFVFVIVFVVL